MLISDTHGYLDSKLIKHIQTVDEVWHAGDIGDIKVCKEIEKLKPLKAVFGNIDGTDLRNNYPEHFSFNCEKVKVLITHIGGYPGKYPNKIKQLIQTLKPDLFICGHSHILKIMFDKINNLLHINPGASGIQGFHNVKTAVKFEIDGTEIKNASIIELGKRA